MDSKKNIGVCLLNDAFPPAIDGVGNVLFNYANVLHKGGVDITVSTPEYPESNDDYEFEVLRYPSINTIEKIGYTTGVPFEISYLAELKKKNIDIIHVHCPMTSMILARILRDSIKKPIIFTYHTKYDIDIRRTIREKHLQEKAIQAIVKNISSCDEVWAVSKGAAENLHSLGYTGDIRIMENGVDMPKGKVSEEEILTIRKEYSLKDEIPSYLFVGRMMWYKGIKIILDALKKLNDSGKEFKMVFVGSGIEQDDIKEYCSSLGLDERVLFVGPILDRHKLKCIFSSFDVFLFPSSFDTNGLVVREAASSGLSSVLIEGSCAAEGTIDKQNAFWIQENSDSLYDILESTDVEAFKKAGARAMEDLYLSWEDACQKAYRRYEEVLDQYHYEERDSLTDDALNKISDLADLYGDVQELVKRRNIYLKNRKEEIREDLHEIRDQIEDEIETWKQIIKERLT